ncbi:ankyrin repeat domain-containing protein, partial [Streptomyces albidoflavus]|nr:ankyrin repeat domain-containing protein [Streptomyces albidoflavus]
MGETYAEHGTDPANAAAEELFSALYEADEDLVAALLGAGVSPEADDGGGGTALHSAAVDGRAAVVRMADYQLLLFGIALVLLMR